MEDSKKELIKSLLPDEASAARLVDYVIQSSNKRPKGTSKTSRYPYYKRVFGERVKKWLDEMNEGKCHKYLYYEQWCEGDNAVSPQTLYHQVNQGKNFLIDHLDPEGKYKDMLDVITIRANDEKTALCIRWNAGVNTDVEAVSVPVEASIPRWKVEVMEWLEGKGDKPLHISGLSLREEEIVEVKELIVGVQSVVASIKSEYIKMMRINLE